MRGINLGLISFSVVLFLIVLWNGSELGLSRTERGFFQLIFLVLVVKCSADYLDMVFTEAEK